MADYVILLGGGGHAKVIVDCIRSRGKEVVGILDDGIAAGTTILGIPVLGKIPEYENYKEVNGQKCKFIISIGNNRIRQRIAAQLEGNVEWATAIHVTAIVSAYAMIGNGSVVMPGAVINAGAQVGAHCIVNTGAIVEHDNVLADFVHVSPAAALGGTVTVGELTHIGIGATVRNNINICSGVTIGAGAVVVKDIQEPGTYVGVPVKKIK